MRFILIFSLILLTGCDKDSEPLEPVDLSVQTITGEWQLTKQYVSPGGQTTWKEVENGPVLKFLADNTFQHSRENCSSGTYSISDDIIRLNCVDSETPVSYRIREITSKTLEISFVGCIEACLYHYEKR